MADTSYIAPTHRIHTCLWMEKDGLEAAKFYTSLFKNSRITNESGVLVTFQLEGQDISIINGGPHFTLSPAVSLFTICEDQAEIDRLWAAFTADGGKESQCGWVTDKFGVSWQIVPRCLMDMQFEKDEAKRKRAHEAMLKSVKFDIETLTRAFNGTEESG